MPSTNKIFFLARAGFDPDEDSIERWTKDEVGRVICTRSIEWVLELDIVWYFDSM